MSAGQVRSYAAKATWLNDRLAEAPATDSCQDDDG
ncbi:hypothetical protein BH24ACT3_BH24ACT3_02280 [soil metagenome]